MNRKHLLSAGLLALATGSGAGEPPRQNFECDTPAGHFSYWNRSLPDGAVSVSGKLSVNELREDKKWSPTALVILEGGGDGKTRYGLRLYAVAKISDGYFIEIVTASGNQKLGLGLIPNTKEAIPFSVSLEDGDLRVNVGGTEESVKASGFKPAKLELSCSTGDFEFKDFVVEEPGKS